MAAEASCRVLAHAKLNLSLAILAREPNGYHQIETLFCGIELADELEVVSGGDDISLEVLPPPEALEPGRGGASSRAGAAPAATEAPAAPGAPDLGPVDRNLATRSARLFAERTGLAGGVRIMLTKRIPVGAGLGGGSSDAAAVLTALNRLHDDPLPRAALLELGGEIGSDVPFFLTGSALALGWGRGGRLLPLPPLPSAPVLLAVPPKGIPTADAYAALSHRRGPDTIAPPRLLPPALDWNGVAAHAHNDFEDVVFEAVPTLAELRTAIAASGAAMARLTGTGSVVYGIYPDVAAAERARNSLAADFDDVVFLLTRTLETL